MSIDTNTSTIKKDDSLNKIVKGTGLVSLGFIFSYFFIFISYILIARKWTVSDVGIFSLSYSIFNICLIITSLGFSQGVVRCIAHVKGKQESYKISGFIVGSIFFSIILSIIVSILLFIFSDYIGQGIFHEPALNIPLKIFAITIPFFSLNIIIIAIFRGFEKIKPTVYLRLILEKILIFIIIVIIIIINLSFDNLFYSYLITGIIIFVILILYISKGSYSLKNFNIKLIFSSNAKELISFSLPLIASNILGHIIIWSSTLMLGILKSTSDTGLLNIADPFAYFLLFPLEALIITFIPVFSKLYSRNQLTEMRNNYRILTKWICLITLPIFFVFFFYPEPLLRVIVGSNYLASANALRILSLGYIIVNFAGPNIATLIVLGKSRFLMLVTLIGSIIIITLNLLLIPVYSFIGAAFAIGCVNIIMALIRSYKVYSLTKIKPYGYRIIKPTLLSIIFIIPIYYFFKHGMIHNWWSLIAIFVMFYLIIIISIILTKSLDEEDLKIIDFFEKKSGIKIEKIKKFLTRFIQ